MDYTQKMILNGADTSGSHTMDYEATIFIIKMREPHNEEE
jgi:hypothetical protein